MKRGWLIHCTILLVVAVVRAPGAEANKVKFAEIIPLLESGYNSPKALASRAVGGPNAALERHRFTQTPEGYLESLGAAPGTEFPAVAGPASQPEITAKNFLKQNGRLFGITSPSVDFTLRKKNAGNGRHSVRLTQTYAGIPVFGGELVVQVNNGGGVEHVAGKLDRDTTDLDTQQLSTKASLTADEAVTIARTHYAPAAAGQELSMSAPELSLFVPGLLQLQGPKRLTWKLDVWSADHQTLGKQVFIDAHSGEFVQEIALMYELLTRQISDANNTSASPGTLVRSEGGAPAALPEANYAYDYIGDTYNFYAAHFGRDGIANDGAALLGLVRYCDPAKPCPLKNAFWNGVRMVFGEGYAVGDDVCGHELTHGVTGNESGLIYLNESGAINESLSDVFGEIIDLTNGKGNDAAGVRWEIGEELPGGYIRYMKDPTSFSDPDWRGSSYYKAGETAPGTDAGDHGGVHSNSGINNKLCYLLTDGDTFRDIPVTGMGIDLVAILYYEANVNLLTSSSGWNELGTALRQAAVNLGWSAAQRANLEHGLLAVGIGTPLAQYFVDENASGACYHTGDSYCAFLFDTGPYNSLGTAVTEHAGAKTLLLRGTAHQTRLAGQARIVAWDGSARIQP